MNLFYLSLFISFFLLYSLLPQSTTVDLRLYRVFSKTDILTKVAIVTVDIGNNLRGALLDNGYIYCSSHGYDLILVHSEYSFFDHFPCSWNLPSTIFAATRAALPLYDWVYYKQADSVFVNHNISIQSLADRVPKGKHMAVTAHLGSFLNDVAVLWKNSPEGISLIERLISLQIYMHKCAAPGMAAIMALILHEYSGTDGIKYTGECETFCDIVSHDVSGHYQYFSLFNCFAMWLKRFGALHWHVKEKQSRHGRIWILPGSDDAIFASGLPSIGDDIAAFGDGPATFYDYFHLNTEYFMMDKRVAFEERFRARYPTTLTLHTGGGARSHTANELARDLAALYPRHFRFPINKGVLSDYKKSERLWNSTILHFS